MCAQIRHALLDNIGRLSSKMQACKENRRGVSFKSTVTDTVIDSFIKRLGDNDIDDVEDNDNANDSDNSIKQR